MSNWKKKRPEHLHPQQPTKPFREAVVPVFRTSRVEYLRITAGLQDQVS
jgi:hypothetical protein